MITFSSLTFRQSALASAAGRASKRAEKRGDAPAALIYARNLGIYKGGAADKVKVGLRRDNADGEIAAAARALRNFAHNSNNSIKRTRARSPSSHIARQTYNAEDRKLFQPNGARKVCQQSLMSTRTSFASRTREIGF